MAAVAPEAADDVDVDEGAAAADDDDEDDDEDDVVAPDVCGENLLPMDATKDSALLTCNECFRKL